MNYLIKNKIEEYEKTSNLTEKAIKINQTIEQIIILYSTIFYCHTVAKQLVSKRIVEIIQVNFYKNNPFFSSWLKLIRASFDLLELKEYNFDKDIAYKLQKLAYSFLPDTSKRKPNQNANFQIILDCLLILRNKAFAHSSSISNENVDILFKNDYGKIPYFLSNYFESLDESKLLLSENVCRSEVDDENYESTFFDLSSEIIKNIKIEECEKLSFDNVYTNSIYCYFNEIGDFISTIPFITFRDNKYYYYSSIDDKKYPVYNEFYSTKYISIKKFEHAFKSLIDENIDLLKSTPISISLQNENGVFHNMPSPQFSKFIGRTDTKKKIIKALENNRIFLVGISGIGGVGKSAIAIKTVQDLIKTGQLNYAYIIWVSAKRTYLTPEGTKIEKQIFSNINQLLDVILEITNFKEYLNLTFSAKKDIVLEILGLDKFLIVVDNFETVSNPNDFLSFFEDIGDKCQDTKLIMTTRHQLGSSEKIIELRELPFNEFKEFVLYLINDKYKIDIKLIKEDLQILFESTGGLPLATEFFLGQVSEMNSFKKVIKKLKNKEFTKESILEFSFNESFNLLSKEEKKVLFAISLLETPTLNSISFITDLDEFDIDDAIVQLQKLSFININYNDYNSIYSLLPLTKSFLDNKIEEHSSLKAILTTKSEEYSFITRISKQIEKYEPDHILTSSKDNISVKLAKTAYILASQENFKKSEEFFNQAKKYDPEESAVWYYWAIAERDFSNNFREEYFKNAATFASHVNQESILFQWGKTLYSFHRPLQCIEILENIVEKNPNNKSAFHIMGKAYYEIGRNLWKKRKIYEMKRQYKRSMEQLDKSLYADPKTDFEKNHNTIGYYFMAKILDYLKKYGEGANCVHKGLQLQPDNYRLYELANHLAERCKRRNCITK